MNDIYLQNRLLDHALKLSKERRYVELENYLLPHNELLIEDIELGFRLAVAWLHLRKTKPGLELTQRLKEKATSSGRLTQLGRIELVRSAFLSRDGKLDEAEAAAQYALLNHKGPESTHQAAEATNSIGVILCMRGRWDEAIPHLNRALVMFQTIGYSRGVGSTHHNIGLAHRYRSRWALSEDFFFRASAYYSRHGTTEERVFTEAERSLAILGLGDHELAEAMARRAVEQCRRLTTSELLGEVLRVLGTLLRVAQKVVESEHVLLESLDLARTSGSSQLEAEVKEELGLLSLASGALEQASRHFSEARALYTSIGAIGFVSRLNYRCAQLIGEADAAPESIW